MKIYKRQIRPMVIPPALQGMSCKPYPLMPENYWCYEEEEEVLKPIWELNAKKCEGGWGRLEIEERYVEIEPPVIEMESFNPGDTIIITIDPDIVDIDLASQWFDRYKEQYPQYDVWLKFKGVDLVRK